LYSGYIHFPKLYQIKDKRLVYTKLNLIVQTSFSSLVSTISYCSNKKETSVCIIPEGDGEFSGESITVGKTVNKNNLNCTTFQKLENKMITKHVASTTLASYEVF
jgi:hypothetical protein